MSEESQNEANRLLKMANSFDQVDLRLERASLDLLHVSESINTLTQSLEGFRSTASAAVGAQKSLTESIRSEIEKFELDVRSTVERELKGIQSTTTDACGLVEQTVDDGVQKLQAEFASYGIKHELLAKQVVQMKVDAEEVTREFRTVRLQMLQSADGLRTQLEDLRKNQESLSAQFRSEVKKTNDYAMEQVARMMIHLREREENARKKHEAIIDQRFVDMTVGLDRLERSLEVFQRLTEERAALDLKPKSWFQRLFERG